jgi:hypothetical protein
VAHLLHTFAGLIFPYSIPLPAISRLSLALRCITWWPQHNSEFAIVGYLTSYLHLKDAFNHRKANEESIKKSKEEGSKA